MAISKKKSTSESSANVPPAPEVQEPLAPATSKEIVEPPAPETVECQESDTVAEKKRVTSAVSDSFVKKVRDVLEGSKSTKELKPICEAFVKALVEAVKQGESVSFTNNMTFKRVIRDDRTHKNPKTGEEVFKPAHYVFAMEVKPSLKKKFEEIEVPSKGGSQQRPDDSSNEVSSTAE